MGGIYHERSSLDPLKPGFHFRPSQILLTKAWFPYDRPDLPDRPGRPSRLKKNVQTTGTIIWKRYPDDRKRPGLLQNLHDRPDRPDRTQFYPSDRGRLSRPGRLRSSG